MRLGSEAFEEGQEIPVEFTKDGRNLSPPLNWSGLPRRTRELALDVPVQAPPGLDRKQFERAINGHVLDEAELHASYVRRK
jgi:phosphatidylethanolamine-binding protein (PEBP) family uncharacterized protein